MVLAEAEYGTLGAVGSYRPPRSVAKWKGAGVGPTPTYSYSAAAVELSVDRESGIIRVDKVWIAHDIGRSINPLLVIGQIEGSVYMALGEILMEEQVFRKGRHKIPSMLDYKSPTTLEMPPVESILVETLDPEGPYGAKEVGQGPLLPVIPAVTNAVLDAVGVERGRGAAHSREAAGRARRPLPPSDHARLHLSGDGDRAAPRGRRAGDAARGRSGDPPVTRDAEAAAVPRITRPAPRAEAARMLADLGPGRDGRRRRDRPLPEHEAPAVHAQGAGRPARGSRAAAGIHANGGLTPGRADHARRRGRGPHGASTRWPVVARAAGLVASPLLRNAGTIGGNLCVDTRCNYYNQTEFWRASIGYCMKRDGDICLVAPGSDICWALSSSDTAPVMIALGADGDAGVGARASGGSRWATSTAPTASTTSPSARTRSSPRSTCRTSRAGARPTASCAAAGRSISRWSGWRRRCASARAGRSRRRASSSAPCTRPRSWPGTPTSSCAASASTPETIEMAAGIAYKPAKPLDNADLVYSWRKRMVRIEVARALRELAGLPTGDLSAFRLSSDGDLVGARPRLRPRIEAPRQRSASNGAGSGTGARARGVAPVTRWWRARPGQRRRLACRRALPGRSRGSSAPARGAGGRGRGRRA